MQKRGSVISSISDLEFERPVRFGKEARVGCHGFLHNHPCFLRLAHSVGSKAAAMGAVIWMWHQAHAARSLLLGDELDVDLAVHGKDVAPKLEDAGFIRRNDAGLFEIVGLEDYFNRRPGYVYAMDRGGLTKIGRAVDPGKRRGQVQAAERAPVALLAARRFGDRFAAEMALHRRYAHRRERGEWFALAPEERSALVEFLGGAMS